MLIFKNDFIKWVPYNTLFILKSDKDILIMQIYVDHIILVTTNVDLWYKFEKFMQDEIEMSIICELKYFLDF